MVSLFQRDNVDKAYVVGGVSIVSIVMVINSFTLAAVG